MKNGARKRLKVQKRGWGPGRTALDIKFTALRCERPQRLCATNEHELENLGRLAGIFVGAAYEVSNSLGAGFPEKIHERRLAN